MQVTRNGVAPGIGDRIVRNGTQVEKPNSDDESVTEDE